MASLEGQGPTIDHAAPGGVGLIIIDMINDFGGDEGLIESAKAAAEVIRELRLQADRSGTPTVYVNDNHGQWHSERSRIVERFAAGDAPGRAIVERIKPRDGDYFVIKPQFSGFYATNLPVLLPQLGVNRLVLTGGAADICVLFTAADAHMRDYGLWVPSDAVASEGEDCKRWALEIMRKSMGAETEPAAEMRLESWIAG